MRPDELEALIELSVRTLPSPRAPETLLPRVLAAVSAWRDRPWYARAWFTWPAGLQIASGAAFVVLLVGAAMLVSHAAVAPTAMIDAAVSRVAAAGAAVQTVGAVFETLWRGLVRPVAPYALAVVAMMCLACAAFAAALNQIVMGRAVHR